MKIYTLVVILVIVSGSLAGRPGCEIPLSKTDEGFKFFASSNANGLDVSFAHLDAKRGWCAKTETKYREYLQVNLSNVRHIAAVETQGFEWSYREFYVKEYLLGYSIDGKKWKFYKSRSKSGGKLWTTFVGNSDVSTSSRHDLHPSFVAKYIRVYPLRFSRNGMCLKLELYGCNKALDCTHFVKLDKNQKLNITSPSYPSTPPSGLHCNWLISLPKPDTHVSLVSLDFDVGGSNSSDNYTSCITDVVTVYKNFYQFSKYLVGAYCNSTNHIMPRVMNISVEYLRIVFDGGNTLIPHRGFNLIVWITDKDVETTQSCENSTISLDCRGHDRNIQVNDVFYGQRRQSDVCSLNGRAKSVLSKGSCRVPDVLPKLQSSCDFRNVCKISIERKTFAHNCPASEPVEMFVIYNCNATERVVFTSAIPSVATTFKSTTASRQIPVDDVSSNHGSTFNVLQSTKKVANLTTDCSYSVSSHSESFAPTVPSLNATKTSSYSESFATTKTVIPSLNLKKPATETSSYSAFFPSTKIVITSMNVKKLATETSNNSEYFAPAKTVSSLSVTLSMTWETSRYISTLHTLPGVVTTTPPPTTILSTSAPAVTPKKATDPVTTPVAARRDISKPKDNIFKSSIVLISAVAGAGLLFVVIIVVTCVCRRKYRKENEKAQISKKCVVQSESLQSKRMDGSDNSLYEKIDDLERELEHVRYEAEPNKYSPLHGMSENPLYEREEPNRPYLPYNVPVSTGTRVLYVGAADNTLDISASEPNYIDNFKSPEELPSNSIPMAKYLEPPKSPADFTSITIAPEPLGTPSIPASSAEDVYEAMDGSQA